MLSAVLVSGTALMVRVANHARHIDPGFSHENVIVLSLGLSGSGIADEQARFLIAGLKERVSALPGVQLVAHSIAVPLGNANITGAFATRKGVS